MTVSAFKFGPGDNAVLLLSPNCKSFYQSCLRLARGTAARADWRSGLTTGLWLDQSAGHAGGPDAGMDHVPQLCPQPPALEGPRPPPTGVPARQPGLGDRGHRGRRGGPPAAPQPCCLGPRWHEQGFTPRALAQFRCRWFSTRHFHSNPDPSEKQMRQQKEKTPASSSSLAQQAQGWASRGCADLDTPWPCRTRTEGGGARRHLKAACSPRPTPAVNSGVLSGG